MSTYLQGPDDVVIYPFDYSGWLNDGETLTASTWTPDSGLSVEASTFTDSGTTATVSVSVTGGTHKAVNHITTSLGEQLSRTLTLIIEEQ